MGSALNGNGVGHWFGAGAVVKITLGKLRLRNADQKQWTDSNSAYAEKGDIITCTGNVFAQNVEKSVDSHATVRIYDGTLDKWRK